MRSEYVLGNGGREQDDAWEQKRAKRGDKERAKLAMGVMPEAQVEVGADLVVYLRLGDKDNAGDVTLLHESGGAIGWLGGWAGTFIRFVGACVKPPPYT
jgi:hypothetical protein